MIDEPQYFLRIAALGKYPTLPITKQAYEEIEEARRTLFVALNIEEKYDLALSNFIDLEKELLALTAESMVRADFGYDRFYQIRSTLNRKLSNFIVSGKMYTEQIANDAAKCSTNKEETRQTITALKSNQYDQKLDYRTMETLRNHIAHSGMTVHTVRLPNHWTTNENETQELEFNIDIFAAKKILAENNGFKRSVLNELPELFDLKKAARSYIASISTIQEETRRITSENINNSRKTIEQHIEAYGLANNGETFALGAYFKPLNSDKKSKPVMLMLEWDDVRVSLTKKNDSITNMHKRYATNTISEKQSDH
ncbi:hypothetical protein [Pseudomonas frederiksbergensis]|uniref:hypothetical protein n=1 Tax=Pseudomonas frederiksbergensis TaxID=104087 RepID=UPI003D1BDA30